MVITPNVRGYEKLGGRLSRLTRIFAYAQIVTKPNLGEGWLAQTEPHIRCYVMCPDYSIY